MQAWRRHGLTAVAATVTAAVGVALDPGATAPWDLLFGAGVFFGALTLLWSGAAAAHRAVRARRTAERWARTSPEEVALRAVTAERARLASDVDAVVRAALLAMVDAAGQARREWDADPRAALQEVQDQGRRATTELRRLLGLLREPVGPRSRQREPSTRPPRRDVLLGAGVSVLAVAEHVGYGGGLGSAGLAEAVVTALAAGTVGWRSRATWASPACGAVFLAGHLLGAPVSSGAWMLICLTCLTWACTVRHPAILHGLVAVAVLATGVVVTMRLRDPQNLPIVVTVIAVATLAGVTVRHFGRSEVRSRRRSADATERLEQAADAAVRAERLDVARELHDLVSCAVGVVVVHTGAAEALLRTDRAAAAEALDVARTAADGALAELAELTALIGGGALGATSPAAGVVEHGLGDLPDLVDRMQRAGLRITVTVDAGGAEPGPAVAGAAYRTVQEALTNAARYATGAPVTVDVRCDGDVLRVAVIDDGPGVSGAARSGYGLVGLRERAERLGGRLESGPGDGSRGFRVVAELPLEVGVPERT